MSLNMNKKNYVTEHLGGMALRDKEDLETDFLVRYLLHSTTIENKVSFTLSQVRAFLEEGNAVLKDFSSAEVRQLENQKKAYFFMLAKTKDGTFFDCELIKEFHKQIMDGDSYAGSYRDCNISVNGSQYVPPRPEKIVERMNDMMERKNAMEDPIEKVAYVHARLDRIHPFLDGNGRTARLVMNYMLIQEGLLPVVIEGEEKKAYFQALEHYKVTKDLEPLKNIISECENRELEKYESRIDAK